MCKWIAQTPHQNRYVTLPQTAELNDRWWSWTELKLENITEFNTAKLPHNNETTKYNIHVIDRLTFNKDRLFDVLHGFNHFFY